MTGINRVADREVEIGEKIGEVMRCVGGAEQGTRRKRKGGPRPQTHTHIYEQFIDRHGSTGNTRNGKQKETLENLPEYGHGRYNYQYVKNIWVYKISDD